MYIAIDVGGTKTEIGFYKNKKHSSLFNSVLFPTDQSFEVAIDRISLEIATNSKVENIEGIGVSFPGIIDSEGNIIQGSNIRDYEQKPLKQKLSVFTSNLRFAQDSSCSSIAEFIFGNISSYKRIIYLIVGTGLGGAFIEVEDRTTVSPIEPCGMIVDRNEGRDHEMCKTKGLLEAYVGGGTIENFYKVNLANISDEDQLWQEVSDYLAIGINNLNCILKPDIVVIGGGIGLKRKKALASVVDKVKKYDEFVLPPKVVFTELGNSSLIGALALFSVSKLKLNI